METKTMSNVSAVGSNCKEMAVKAGGFVKKHIGVFICLTLMVLMVTGVVGAEEAAKADADELWKNMINLIEKWVTRLGGVVMIIGGIMFGLGWQREDASAKSNGITTLMAGAIVIAVVQLISTFAA